MPRLFRPFAAVLLALLLAACAAHRPVSLTLAHVNDTHSALEPAEENLTLAMPGGAQTFRAPLGGMARLGSALADVRAHEPNVLFLHAGDAVQGTLYFNVFEGAAEFDFLNALGVDAMTLGNHEFDKGPQALARMLSLARFPVVSANVDVSAEPALKGRVKPYVVRQVGGERIALVGLTTPVTPHITASVGNARFLEPGPVLAAIVAELKRQDINKIVVLSHCGYEADLELARTVPGIDVIVGGHSHTLLGGEAALGALGLRPAGPYPTRVEGPEGPVLVVQAWKWAEELGVLAVDFDAAGRVAGYTAKPRLLPGDRFRMGPVAVDAASPEHGELQREVAARLEASGVAKIYPEDPAMLAKLAPYKQKVAALQNAPIGARAAVDLVRGTATDPGPILADAYLAKAPGAQVALVGAGGIRRDILAGDITLGQVMAVSPFGNTLVVMDISGAQLKTALEEAVDFRLTTRPPQDGDLKRLPLMHPGGFVYAVHPRREKGRRVDGLFLRTPGGLAAVDPAAVYRLVTNSYLAGGGDGMASLGSISANRVDTGFLDHEALAEYLTRLGVVAPPADVQAAPRVRLDLSGAARSASPALPEHSAAAGRALNGRCGREGLAAPWARARRMAFCQGLLALASGRDPKAGCAAA